MGFDSKALENLRASLDRTIKGYQNDMAKFVVMGLKKETVGSEHGTIPVQKTAYMVGDDVSTAEFVAGGEIPSGDMSVGYIQYNCTRFGRKFAVDVLDAQELSERDILKAEDFVKSAISHGLGALDRKLGAILKAQGSAANNDLIATEALAAGKEFNNYDSATSNPMGSIQALIDDTMGGDTLYLGKDVANALRQHPQFAGDNATSRSAAGKMMPYADFAELLIATFGLKAVLIDGTFYQNGGATQVLSPAQPLAGVCAVGHFDNLVLVERKAIAPSVWEEEAETATYVAAWGSYDIVVGDSALTKGLTNTLE